MIKSSIEVSIRRNSHKLKLPFRHCGLIKTQTEYSAWEIIICLFLYSQPAFLPSPPKNDIINFTTLLWTIGRREIRRIPVSTISEKLAYAEIYHENQNSVDCLSDKPLANECLNYCWAARADCTQTCLHQGSATGTHVFYDFFCEFHFR